FLVYEDQRLGIHAKAQAGRFRPVLEHVAEVAAAARAQDLGAAHAVAAVLRVDDILGADGLEEARPAGARLELRAGGEERQGAAHAGVDAVALVVEEQPAERRLGALAARHLVLLLRELAFPLGVAFLDLGALDRADQLAFRVVDADFHASLLTRFASTPIASFTTSTRSPSFSAGSVGPSQPNQMMSSGHTVT